MYHHHHHGRQVEEVIIQQPGYGFQQPTTIVEVFKYGQAYNDTISFNDESYLQGTGGHKISQIKIFYDQYHILGLHCTYYIFATGQYIEGGRHVHKHHQGTIFEEIVTLPNDEFIVEACGKADVNIDALGFRTSKGRQFFAGGQGGVPWDLKAPPGWHFSAIAGGYGKHLHHVEFPKEPLPQGFGTTQVIVGQVGQVGLQQQIGFQQPQTTVIQQTIPQQINQIGFQQPQTTIIQQQPTTQIGFQQQPQTTIIQQQPTNQIGFQQQPQTTVIQQTIPQQTGFPQQQQTTVQQINPLNNTVQQTTVTQQQFGNQTTTTVSSQTFSWGKQYPDTVIFDDVSFLVNIQGHKISGIKLITDGWCVIGLEAHYYIFATGQHVNGGRHLGKKYHSGCLEEIIKFDNDEYLTEVFGRSGEMIDALGFKTSKGRVFGPIGGPGGNPFDLRAPPGEHFDHLSGGFGSHLHHISLKAAPFYKQVVQQVGFQQPIGIQQQIGFQQQPHYQQQFPQAQFQQQGGFQQGGFQQGGFQQGGFQQGGFQGQF